MRQRRPYMATKPQRRRKETLANETPTLGRPTIFTDELANKICERMANGESLRAICRDPEMPGRTTVLRWLSQSRPFQIRYALAREMQADAVADEILAIADDREGDWVKDAKGNLKPDWENVQRSRLRVDARRWYAAKIAPKKYGEKVVSELVGRDGGPIETSAMLLPEQVAEAVSKILTEAEEALGIPLDRTLSERDRITRILRDGRPVTPALYTVLQQRRKENEYVH